MLNSIHFLVLSLPLNRKMTNIVYNAELYSTQCTVHSVQYTVYINVIYKSLYIPKCLKRNKEIESLKQTQIL